MCCLGPIWEPGLAPAQCQELGGGHLYAYFALGSQGILNRMWGKSQTAPQLPRAEAESQGRARYLGCSSASPACDVITRRPGWGRSPHARYAVPLVRLRTRLFLGPERDARHGVRPTLRARGQASARGSPPLPPGCWSSSVPPRASAWLLAGIRWARGAGTQHGMAWGGCRGRCSCVSWAQRWPARGWSLCIYADARPSSTAFPHGRS